MRPFHIASSTRSSSSGSDSSWPPSDQRLYLVFRPADSEHLRSRMPHIGIPAFVSTFGGGGGGGGGRRVGDGDSGALSALPEDPLEQEEEEEEEGEEGAPRSSPPVAAAPLYYFGFIQEAPAPAGRTAAERKQQAASASDQLSEDGSSLSMGAQSSQAPRSADGAAVPDGVEESLGLQPVRN